MKNKRYINQEHEVVLYNNVKTDASYDIPVHQAETT